MDAIGEVSRHVLEGLDAVIVGQESMKRDCLAVILCQGHALVQGVPGLAKTLTIKTLARLLRLDFQRVQATPDLMPADIIGTSVANLTTGTFQFRPGPVHTDLLLVDEINRMPPRSQAALLECMEERQVTADGTRHQLSPFFTVFATQNPIEFEGTYPLPEAQLDRFLVQIDVAYPTEEQEVALLARAQHGNDATAAGQTAAAPLDPAQLAEARQAVGAVAVEESLFAYTARLVRRTRDWPAIALGASPRAALALLRYAKAMALLKGRAYVIPDDIKDAVPPVLRHRVILHADAAIEGTSVNTVLAEVVRAVDVPR